MTERERASGEQIAQLRSQLSDAEERERAVSQVLQAMSRSAFDLDQVLQTVPPRPFKTPCSGWACARPGRLRVAPRP